MSVCGSEGSNPSLSAAITSVSSAASAVLSRSLGNLSSSHRHQSRSLTLLSSRRLLYSHFPFTPSRFTHPPAALFASLSPATHTLLPSGIPLFSASSLCAPYSHLPSCPFSRPRCYSICSFSFLSFSHSGFSAIFCISGSAANCSNSSSLTMLKRSSISGLHPGFPSGPSGCTLW